jgi:UDP-N-acetylglucosamine--N-acetylmuramyl-(pentapeptide) pyrophosphoryl-undecaprenol N-acetylglucosamine transferase
MRIIITAGGTGGHIMPGIAVAEAIRNKKPDTEILFIGTDRGLEEKLAEKHRLVFAAIKSAGIKGKSFKSIFTAAFTNIAGFIKAVKIISTFKPDWVIGTGGYVPGMVVLAGRLNGAKCAIQEQNSIPGLTNRILSRISHRIFLAYPDTKGVFPKAKAMLTGNPLRPEFIPVEFDRKKALVIMGGSLGAASINMAAIDALKILKDELDGIEIIHQTGQADIEKVRQAYSASGVKVQAEAFIDDMAQVFSRAALVVCRAGGITLSELSKTGVPAIMIPLPTAADNHQYHNALYISAAGGGWILPQDEMTTRRLADEIRARLKDQKALSAAAFAIAKLGLGDGTELISREIIRCSGE